MAVFSRQNNEWVQRQNTEHFSQTIWKKNTDKCKKKKKKNESMFFVCFF